MGLIAGIGRRVGYLFRRLRFDKELDQEIRFHIETRAEELEQEGMSQSEALAQAKREFGSDLRMRESTRSAWQFRWIEDLASDLRYAARSFRRSPVFALTAISCLALGIGANTTIFSLSTEMLFSKPSARDPQRLAQIWVGGGSVSSMRDYRFIREARIFDGLAGENEETQVNWREGENSRRLNTVRVTDNFFDVIGVPVAMGRPIEPGEADSVVVTNGFWKRSLGGDANVIGRKIILDGRPYTVAGVLPADHRTVTGFGFSPDLYLPVSGEEASVTLYARLPEGMTRQVAHDRLKSVCEDLDRQYPHTQENWASGIRISSVSGIDRFDSDDFIAIAAFFAVLMIVVWLVLLIACANVAGLLLARGANRAHEFAVRMSLGARRGRIIRQLLTETFLLALCGTVAGLILNLALSSALSNFQLPLPLPLQLTIKPDFRLLAYAITVSIVCTLVAGLIPAFKSTRWGINASLKQGERQVGRTNLVLRNTLVVGQIVVSVVLLSAGLVFTRNLLRASTMDPGFDTERTIWSSVRLVPENYPKAEKRTVLISQVLDRLRTLPGIESASIARVVPLNGHLTTGTGMRTDLNSNVAHVTFNENYVGDGYFKTLGIRVLLGREFLPSDRRGSPRVAILNENLATKLFGSTDPTGHAIYFEKEDPILIVGVVRNSKYFTLGEENAFAFYQPYAQWEGSEELQFLVRVAGNPDNYSTIITKAIGDMDSSAAIETKPMNRALVFALLPSRVGAAILGSVGLLALALVAIGLYGILSYSVSGRRQEIGLRVVLGAKPASILWLVVRQGLVLVITGIVIGVALSMALLPPLSAFLISGVRPTDYTNFVVTGIVLCVVAMIATVMPATRALLVDPAIALRSE